ncbi:hypothetical protein RJ640_020999 [Escallonia rubra]|uniref:Transcription repressor n=1 Tax=Escallonia rubra TaxID=112253 RepID=A0AA88RN33_9ASTE|nr:hypothetical protein RJ640_020999 [Escallonia rubra]
MAKRFKLRLSFSSFQFCRSKKPASLAKSPSPLTYLFSPINPKAREITYPNCFPDPPPSTPNHPSFKSYIPPSKIRPVDQKMCNSPASDYSGDMTATNTTAWPNMVTPAKPKSKKKMEKKVVQNRSKASVCVSISSADSGWFSEENELETESLFSSSRSFDSSCDFGYPLEAISERGTGVKHVKKNGMVKVRKLQRILSNSWKDADESEDVTPPPPPPRGKNKSVLRRLMMPCAEAKDSKVNESFAVVKKSEDPYEDFKRSMLEMILEKQMFEAKDLEQLLQCFLALNSRHHHAIIVLAFTEIWEALFCNTPKSHRASVHF